MTRQELRSKLARSLDLDPTTPGVVTTAEFNQLMDEALEIVAEAIEPIERYVTIPMVGGWTYYRLSAYASDLILPLRLYDLTNERPVVFSTLADFDQHFLRWETVTGDPQWWAYPGWDWIALYPHAKGDGGVLRLDYAAWAQTPLDDAVPLELQEAEEDTVLGFARILLQAWQWQETQAVKQVPDTMKTLLQGRFRSHRRLPFGLYPGN